MSRKKKKAIKNSLIIYDVSSVPKGMSLDQVLFHFHDKGILIYDGTHGDKPRIMGRKKKGIAIRHIHRYDK